MSDKTRWPSCEHGLPKDQCDLCRPAGSSFAAPASSANTLTAKEALKKELAKIIDDAFTALFDADNAGAIDHFDGFARTEAAIEKHWPNAELSDAGESGVEST